MRLGWSLAALVGAVAPSEAAAQPDPSLIAAAGRACQQKFQAPVEPILLEAPGVVLRAGEKDSQWRYEAVVGGTASDAPKTIFCVRSRHEQDGTYSDGSRGYAQHWTITALSWPDGRVRRKGQLVALAPARKDRTSYRQDQYGTVEAADLQKWFAVTGAPALLGNVVGSAYLSPDRRTLALAVGTTKKKATSLLDWPSQAPRRRIEKQWPAGFLADGRLGIPDKGGLRLWDPASGKTVGLISEAGVLPVLTRDGTRVMTGLRGDHLYDLPSGRLVTDIPIAVWRNTSAMSTGGHRICGVENKKVVLWSPVERRTAAAFEVGIREIAASYCAVAGDGETAAADTREGLYLLNAKDSSTLRLSDSLRPACLAMSGSGRWLAAARDRDLILWDLAARREMRREPIQEVYFNCELAFSGDDALLRLGTRFGSEGNTMFWDVQRLLSEATVPASK